MSDVYYPKLRYLREKGDRSQRQIAELLNISQQHYQLYECGKRQIPLDKAIVLAEYYDVSLDYIADLTDDRRKYW